MSRGAAKIVGFEQHEASKYPYSAVHKAITNAVTHRDYWHRGAEVRTCFFHDRIAV